MVSSGSRFRQANDTIRSTISIGARFRAIDRFKALAGAALFSSNALLRFGRSMVLTSAGFAAVEFGLKLLFNKFTAILAVITSGLATKAWYDYERAARVVQFQLRLTGLEASVAGDRLNDIKTILGTSMATEFFRGSALAAQGLIDIAGGGDEVLRVMRQMERGNIDQWQEFGEIMEQVLSGRISDESALRQLRRIFPGLSEDITNVSEAFKILDEMSKNAYDELTNTRKSC